MTKQSPPNAYEEIYEAIISGDIRPGDRLRETTLAEQIGLSRTPIREAIRKLESDGIVVHEPRVGAIVKTLSQQEIVELYEMRIVVESTAARMAARHISDAELRALEDINAEMGNATGGGETARLNRDFHRCILNAAKNRYLVQSFEVLAHNFVLLGATTIETPERIIQVIEQHDTIIEALRNRDEDESAKAMADHMDTSLDYRLKVLRQ